MVYAFFFFYYLDFFIFIKISFFELGIDKLNVTKYIAKIKCDNKKSIKMFEKLRFHKVIIFFYYFYYFLLFDENNTFINKYNLYYETGKKK